MQEKDFIWNFLNVFTTQFAHANLLRLDNVNSKLSHSNNDSSSAYELRLIQFKEICIKLYKPLSILQKSFKLGKINLYLSNKFLKEFKITWEKIFPEFICFKSEDFLEFANEIVPKFQSVSYDNFKNLQIFLDSTIAAEQSITWILKRHLITISGVEKYKVQIAMASDYRENISELSLHEYRKLLISLVILNVLKLRGYTVDETKYYQLPNTTNYQNSLLVVLESLIKSPIICNKENQCSTKIVRINIGKVTIQCPQHSKLKSNGNETLGNFLNELKIGQNNSQEYSNDDSFPHYESNSLTNILSTINYELLIKSPKSEIIFQFENRMNNSNQTQEPILTFYTYARIISILNTFSKRIHNGYYKPLPSENEIDFSLITKSNEELSLIDAIMEWPRVIDCIIDLHSNEIRISLTLRFLNELMNRFKLFYGKNLVLMQPSSPCFNTMYARIYLLKAILVIIQQAFELFDQVYIIQPQKIETAIAR